MDIKCYFKYICLASHKSYYNIPPFLPSPPTLTIPRPALPKNPNSRLKQGCFTAVAQSRCKDAATINDCRTAGNHNYSLFIIHHSLHHSPQKSGAGSRPLRLIIFCLLLYPLTAQDLRKQRQDRQYSYKLCRMCSYRPQRNIRYPDRRTGDCRH